MIPSTFGMFWIESFDKNIPNFRKLMHFIHAPHSENMILPEGKAIQTRLFKCAGQEKANE